MFVAKTTHQDKLSQSGNGDATETVLSDTYFMHINLSETRVMNFAASRIWPILSDTATVNRKMGLAPMSFTTINGVRHGQQKMLGMTIRWTEAPWEWKQERWLKNARVYSSGFFHKIEGYFEIKPLAEDRCEVLVQFSVHHKYGLLAGLLNVATKGIIKKLLDEVEKGAHAYSPNFQTTGQMSLEQWLGEAQKTARARIAPKLTAREMGSDWQDVLRQALSPGLGGRLSLRFDAVCPHCRGAKKSVPRLTDLPERMECESCEIDFVVGTQESIEVSLSDNTLSPEEANVDFCSADVTHKPTIAYQRLGGVWLDDLTLVPGVYALKRRGQPRAITLLVDESAERRLLDVDSLWKDPSFAPLRLHPEVGLRSHQMKPMDLIMLEQLDRFRGALIASEVILHPEFEKLIPAESLATDFPMEMGRRALLFTDVVGSTELYYKIGDTAAFQKVRESFQLIGEVTKRHEGVLVKTIGDATMFAFSSAEAALKAAIEIQEANRGRDMKLRASLHYGPCLSVGTKDGQDFFGDTVNICAKFQSEAEAGQVVFEEGLRHEISPAYWQSWEKQLEKIPFVLKGESGRKFELYRLSLN